jgi:hypothetical protein
VVAIEVQLAFNRPHLIHEPILEEILFAGGIVLIQVQVGEGDERIRRTMLAE